MKRRTRPAGPGKKPGPSSSPAVERIYGVHAVRAALANPRRTVCALYATRNGLARIADILETQAITVADATPEQLSRRLGGDAVHQGVMAEAVPLAPVLLDEVLQTTPDKPLIVLDQVTDPHNAGAILRSAAAFDAGAIIMTRRNSPPLDGALAKAASGAVEHVPVLLVTNLARTLEELGKNGVQRIGLEGDAAQALEAADIHSPCALVLGAEHRGLRRLTAEKCDLLCRLTTPGALKSLNVSNAAAVALHTIMTAKTVNRRTPSGTTLRK